LLAILMVYSPNCCASANFTEMVHLKGTSLRDTPRNTN
jgi:hypothetical protein